MSKGNSTTLNKLRWIERHATICNIHYCNAGVGFQFYVPVRGEDVCTTSMLESMHATNWRKYLITHGYQKTFTQAVDAEYKRLKQLKGARG